MTRSIHSGIIESWMQFFLPRPRSRFCRHQKKKKKCTISNNTVSKTVNRKHVSLCVRDKILSMPLTALTFFTHAESPLFGSLAFGVHFRVPYTCHNPPAGTSLSQERSHSCTLLVHATVSPLNVKYFVWYRRVEASPCLPNLACIPPLPVLPSL